MNKIGIISASQATIDQIIHLAADMLKKDQYMFEKFRYETLEEIEEIISANKKEISGWIFSGPNAYIMAKPYLCIDDNSIYCKFTGNEIYKVLLEKVYAQDRKDLRLSIDCPASNIFSYSESVAQLLIPKETLFFKEYQIPFDFEEVLEYHLDLWNSGKIDGVITTLYRMYSHLKKQNIPVELIKVSVSSIRQAVVELKEKMNSLHFKNSQVGLAIIEISNYHYFIEKADNFYKLQKLDLEIKSAIVDFVQNVNGYLSDKGHGYYEVIASRGLLEKNMNVLKDTIAHIETLIDVPICAGIGFGSTFFAAQLNANRAVAYKKDSKNLIFTIIDENGDIVEYIENKEVFSYNAIIKDPVLIAQLKTANVAVQTYQKILAVLNHMDWSDFTSLQLAQQLRVTERNVQRILSGLSKAGLVECVGLESLGKRGRPTRKYQVSGFNEKNYRSI